MTKAPAPASWQRAVVLLAGTVVAIAVIVALYWAQVVFIPVALAIFLTFVLSPVVTALQRRRLGRLPSVLVVVLSAALLLAGAAWLVTTQVTGLLRDLPTHTENIMKKTRALRGMGQGSLGDGLDKMFQEVSSAWNAKPPEGGAAPGQLANQGGEAGATTPERPAAVVLQPQSSPWLGHFSSILQPVAASVGTLALALVLVVFMLLKREDLRNRLIRLAGHGSLTTTTKAVEEAGLRISRYLLMQLLINGSCGLIFTVALLIIGVPYAPLWGFLLALLRYVPYIGSWLALLLPLGLSVAIAPGWGRPLAVLASFVILELTAANVVEPRLFGHSIGVSEVALLIAAAFWAFLWGPIGLVLSGPLTVCLVVLGRYVPRLAFLDVLLGDQPALDPEVTYYQRLLAHDQDEAEKLVLERAKGTAPEEVFDQLLIPALSFAKRDLERDDLSEADAEFVVQATREIVAGLGKRQAVVAPPEHCAGQGPAAGLRGGCRCRSARSGNAGCTPGSGQVAGGVARRGVVDVPTCWRPWRSTARPSSVSGPYRRAGWPTAATCASDCLRFPGLKIVVGRWGLKGDIEENGEQLREAGADLVAMTLADTRDQLNTWLPVLGGEQSRASELADARRQALAV